MSFFDFIKKIFGNNSTEYRSVESIPQNEMNVHRIIVSSFFKGRAVYEKNKMTGLEINLTYPIIKTYSPEGEYKTFDMFLSKEKPEIIKSMVDGNKKFQEEHMLIILRHMRNTDYRYLVPNFIQKVFGDSLLPFAYCKYLVEQAELEIQSIFSDMASGKNGIVAFNDVKDKVVNDKPIPASSRDKIALTSMNKLEVFLEVFSDWIKICQIINQFSDEFSQNFLMINFVEDFFSNVQKEITILNCFYDLKDISTILLSFNEKKQEIMSTLMKKSLTGVVNEVGNVQYTENQMFLMRVLQSNNVEQIPHKEFSNEVNVLLESVLNKLDNVSTEYFKEDLSQEVQRMFDDVLNNVLKHYFAIPVSYRKEMFNAEGKTVEMMLMEVLEVINQRLHEIGQKSHQSSLHEVSVMREFSRERWEQNDSL